MKKFIIISLFFSLSIAHADTIAVTLPTLSGNSEAVGVSVNEDKIFLHEARIKSSPDGMELTFERKDENTLSAGVAFSDTAQQATSLLASAKSELLQCEENIDQKTISQTQPALIQALVQVRAEKRELLKQKVSELLQGEFLQKLQQLEAGFGLNVGAPLSSSLSPYELSERISLLALVMGNIEDKNSQPQK